MRYAGLWLMGALALQAQIESPRIGCYSNPAGAFEVMGLAGSFIVIPAQACAPIENSWRIVEEEDGPWLERRDAASGAVEVRRKLEGGSWAVFADGTLAQLDALNLPAAPQSWSLIAPNWMLVRTTEASILLRPDGRWFYLPGVPTQ